MKRPQGAALIQQIFIRRPGECRIMLRRQTLQIDLCFLVRVTQLCFSVIHATLLQDKCI